MPETQPTPPPSREELLLAFLLEQDGARRVMEGADSGVTFTTPDGTSLAYFLRPDGSAYVRNAAGRELPEYLCLLMDTVLGDPPTDPAVEAATPASSEVAVEASTPAGPEVAAVAARAALIEALPDQCRANPARAFEPDALDAMNALGRDDPGSFAVLWDALRRGRSVSLRDLRAAMRRRAQLQYEAAAVADAGAGSEGGSQADRLIRLVPADMLFVGLREEADSANSASGEVYVAMTVETHRETWPLSSNRFRHWLVQKYLAEHRSAPRSDAITQAIGTLGRHGPSSPKAPDTSSICAPRETATPSGSTSVTSGGGPTRRRATAGSSSRIRPSISGARRNARVARCAARPADLREWLGGRARCRVAGGASGGAGQAAHAGQSAAGRGRRSRVRSGVVLVADDAERTHEVPVACHLQ